MDTEVEIATAAVRLFFGERPIERPEVLAEIEIGVDTTEPIVLGRVVPLVGVIRRVERFSTERSVESVTRRYRVYRVRVVHVGASMGVVEILPVPTARCTARGLVADGRHRQKVVRQCTGPLLAVREERIGDAVRRIAIVLAIERVTHDPRHVRDVVARVEVEKPSRSAETHRFHVTSGIAGDTVREVSRNRRPSVDLGDDDEPRLDRLFTGEQDIAARPPTTDIGTIASIDGIVAVTAREGVDAVLAGDIVIIISGIDPVVAVAGVDRVVASECADGVVAVAGIHRVVATRTDDDIGAVPTIERSGVNQAVVRPADDEPSVDVDRCRKAVAGRNRLYGCRERGREHDCCETTEHPIHLYPSDTSFSLFAALLPTTRRHKTIWEYSRLYQTFCQYLMDRKPFRKNVLLCSTNTNGCI